MKCEIDRYLALLKIMVACILSSVLAVLELLGGHEVFFKDRRTALLMGCWA